MKGEEPDEPELCPRCGHRVAGSWSLPRNCKARGWSMFGPKIDAALALLFVVIALAILYNTFA